MLTPKENYLKAMRAQTPEYLPNQFMDCNYMVPMIFIERYDEMESGYDGFGVHWTYVEDVCAPMTTPGKVLCDDITDWKNQITIPDLDSYDWEFYSTRALEHCDEENKVNYCMNINGMFERLHACIGMQEALCSLITDEDAVIDFVNAVADHKIRFMEKCKKYYHGEIFNMHDDYGANDRTFMSLETWRKIFKKPLSRIVEACHDLGMLYEHHSCGYIEPFVDDFVEMGMDAVNTWQWPTNKNVRAIKDKYQDRLCFIGGMDSQGVLDREDATDEEWEAEIRRAIDLLAPGGSYIPFPITLGINFMSVYLPLMETYGKTYYKEHPEAVR